jgi:hypothetical protein
MEKTSKDIPIYISVADEKSGWYPDELPENVSGLISAVVARLVVYQDEFFYPGPKIRLANAVMRQKVRRQQWFVLGGNGYSSAIDTYDKSRYGNELPVVHYSDPRVQEIADLPVTPGTPPFFAYGPMGGVIFPVIFCSIRIGK